MHLCIVIFNTCPSKEYNLTIGGAEKQLLRLIPEYEKKVERLSLITNYTTYIPKKATTTIKQSFGNYSRIWSPIINFILRKRLRIISTVLYILYISYNIIKIHHKDRINFLNIHMLDSSYYPVMLLAKLLRIKTIYKPASVPKPYKNNLNPMDEHILNAIIFQVIPFLTNKVILSADYIQALNPEIRDELKNTFLYPENRVALIPNGVKSEDFKNLYNPGLKTFGYVGRLDKIKNIPTIIEAFSKFKNKYPLFKLVLYGDGPERSKIERIIKKFNLQESIKLFGFEPDFAKIYSSFDYYIISSYSEGISNSLLEAMAVGMPILASNIKGNTLLIKDGEEGLLFNPHNVDDLKEKMIYIVENPRIIENLRKKAQIKIQKEFDIKIIVKQLLTFMKFTYSFTRQ